MQELLPIALDVLIPNFSFDVVPEGRGCRNFAAVLVIPDPASLHILRLCTLSSFCIPSYPPENSFRYHSIHYTSFALSTSAQYEQKQ